MKSLIIQYGTLLSTQLVLMVKKCLLLEGKKNLSVGILKFMIDKYYKKNVIVQERIGNVNLDMN